MVLDMILDKAHSGRIQVGFNRALHPGDKHHLTVTFKEDGSCATRSEVIIECFTRYMTKVMPWG